MRALFISLSFLGLSFLSAGPAAAEENPKSRLSSDTIFCAFQKPLEVGSSVTGQVATRMPFFQTILQKKFGVEPGDYKSSPSELFVKHYRELEKQRFYAPRYLRGEDGHENFASMIPNGIRESGSGQIESLLEGDRKQAYARASIVVGLDLFYWDAIWDSCGYGMPAYYKRLRGREDEESRRGDIEHQIKRIILSARETGKILMLGNVPEEVEANIKINAPGFWSRQNLGCVRSINATLEAHCHKSENCYIVDFRGLADRINNGEELAVESLDGQKFGLRQLRPDGVHLSRAGSLYVFERMREAFEKNPPACGRAPLPLSENLPPNLPGQPRLPGAVFPGR